MYKLLCGKGCIGVSGVTILCGKLVSIIVPPLPLLLFSLFIGPIEMQPVPDQNYHGFLFSFKVVLHLSSIDEVEDLLHEVVEKDCLTQAEAKVPEKC